MAQNGKKAAYKPKWITQNGKNAVYKPKWLKMVKTQLTSQNCSKW